MEIRYFCVKNQKEQMMNRLNKIRRAVFVLLLTVCCCFPAAAQTMEEAFVAMPDSLLPLLTKNNRLDMVDFVHNHMEARVENRLGSDSRMETLTGDYLKVKLTENAVVEMKVLPWQDSLKVVAVVETVYAPAPDSRVTFYDREWRAVEAFGRFRTAEGRSADTPRAFGISAFLKLPEGQLTTEQQQLLRELEELPLYEYRLAPDRNTFFISLSYGVLNRDQQETVKPILQDLVLEWK